jgi:hypothetical protein
MAACSVRLHRAMTSSHGSGWLDSQPMLWWNLHGTCWVSTSTNIRREKTCLMFSCSEVAEGKAIIICKLKKEGQSKNVCPAC